MIFIQPNDCSIRFRFCWLIAYRRRRGVHTSPSHNPQRQSHRRIERIPIEGNAGRTACVQTALMQVRTRYQTNVLPEFVPYGRTYRRSTYSRNAWAFFGLPDATDHGLLTTYEDCVMNCSFPCSGLPHSVCVKPNVPS